MPKERDDERLDNVEGNVPSRHDYELRRRRIAVLIGRLIARDWLRGQTVGETLDGDDREAHA